jgi:hypothetical protein
LTRDGVEFTIGMDLWYPAPNGPVCKHTKDCRIDIKDDVTILMVPYGMGLMVSAFPISSYYSSKKALLNV